MKSRLHNICAFIAICHVTIIVSDGNNQNVKKKFIYSQIKKVNPPGQDNNKLTGEETAGRILTRCRLRPVNWWNYTMGEATIVSGDKFDSTVGAKFSSYISNQHEYLIHLHHMRLLSIFQTFLFRGYDPAEKNTLASSTANTNTHRITESQCSLVFIYAQWCPFSRQAVPYINAIARAFPQLPVVAIDVDQYLRYRWSLRIFSIPKVKIFIGGLVFREYTGSDNSLDELTEFLWKNIRLMPMGPLKLEHRDFDGPIPADPITLGLEPRILQLSWLVFLVCLGYISTCFTSYPIFWRRLVSIFKLALDTVTHRQKQPATEINFALDYLPAPESTGSD